MTTVNDLVILAIPVAIVAARFARPHRWTVGRFQEAVRETALGLLGLVAGLAVLALIGLGIALLVGLVGWSPIGWFILITGAVVVGGVIVLMIAAA